ncbi:Mfa1 family fimbria major subunit [Porphyromonas uenonis]|uniref:Mfa1 family fimbria major subunit n=1 Tax=Porphyromonas uenonis TaxID=281920 RepID=UPI0004716FB4|nr:Mfa1 family fimbria major subunit [Porphyromonas uenonis]
MKKFIYATLALAAVLLFASCKNDKNQPKNEAGDAYVSFTFNLPQGGTRAGVDGKNAGDFYDGTADEQAIKTVRVVLFDPSSEVVKYAFDYNITATGGAAATGEIAGTATAAKFTTKAKKVETQDYKMLAILNGTADVLAATAEGKYLKDAQAVLTSDVKTLSGDGKAIMMSNDRGLVDVKSTSMKEKDTEAEAAPVTVNVDRILAKVFVGGTPECKNGKLTNIKWQLNTTNTKTFIYRQFGKIAATDFPDETATDASTRFNRYAKDPNYSGAFNAADFNYLEGTPEITGTFGYDDANGQYCLENTMDAASQKVQQTTSFILSGTWTPENHDGITFTEGETWYDWKGWSFTKAKMAEYKTILDDNTNTKPEINGTPNGFKAALKAAITAGLAVNPQGDVTTASGTFGEIVAYKGGVCYYQTNLIRHFNDTLSGKEMGYGRYGVVRNNIYKINIKEIKHVGTPTVTPDKDNPRNDDPSMSYISFDINVNPWIVRTQDISL